VTTAELPREHPAIVSKGSRSLTFAQRGRRGRGQAETYRTLQRGRKKIKIPPGQQQDDSTDLHPNEVFFRDGPARSITVAEGPADGHKGSGWMLGFTSGRTRGPHGKEKGNRAGKHRQAERMKNLRASNGARVNRR